MSEDGRMVFCSAEQAQILEDVGVDLMRQDDDRAMKLLALSLGYKFAKLIEPPRPSNVIDLHDFSRRIGA